MSFAEDASKPHSFSTKIMIEHTQASVQFMDNVCYKYEPESHDTVFDAACISPQLLNQFLNVVSMLCLQAHK